MKSNLISHSIFAVAVLSLVACKPELKTITPSKGQADFSRYIAVGNSLTSGFSDGGLYLEGQKNSFPEMIAVQMKNVGGGEFYTPFFNDAQADGTGYKKLSGFNATGGPVLADVAPQAVRGQIVVPGFGNVNLLTKYTGEINNYGVPGIKLGQITFKPYGNLNGYFERMLPGNSPANNTAYLDFVTEKPFTFFSMWLGNNDILGYATTGGASPADQPTDKATFAALYNLAATTLTKNGAKGVVATIPNVLNTPYFKTVTLAALLQGVQVSAPTVNSLYIRAANGESRVATIKDYFVLPFSSLGLLGKPNGQGIPYGLHQANPIESQYVLDEAEAAIVNDYVSYYNNTIKSVAAAKNLAVVDSYAILNEYTNGKTVNGAELSAAYITGNVFSLDGIHLTPIGYAIMANEFIKSINSTYGSSIPTVDVTKYRGVKFP